jgi:hypothetical protein
MSNMTAKVNDAYTSALTDAANAGDDGSGLDDAGLRGCASFGVALALEYLVKRDCFTGRTLELLDELERWVLADDYTTSLDPTTNVVRTEGEKP